MPAKLSGEDLERQKKSPTFRYLNRAYLGWQQRIGEQKSLRAFADYLEIKTPTFHKLWTGRTIVPEPDTLASIASKLGDEIYAVVGVERPDNVRQFVLDNWGKLDVDTVSEINRIVERALSRAGTRTPARGVALADRSRKA